MSTFSKAEEDSRKFIDILILWLLKLAVLLIPIFFIPLTFEVFEFNKQNLLWTLIFSAFTLWVVKIIIIDRKLIYKRTPLDLPLLILLVLWGLSLIFGVDWFSSLFGYYGRFVDSYLSTLSFVLFYFLAVNNVTKRDALDFLNIFLISAGLTLLVGLLSLAGLLPGIIGDTTGRLAILSSPSFNTTGGSSESFALFASIILVFIVALYSYNLRGRKRLLKLNLKYYLLGLLAIVVLGIINFILSWVVLVISLTFLLAFSLYIIYINREADNAKIDISIAPIFSLFIVAMVFIFLFSGTGSLLGVSLPREVVLPVSTARQIAWTNFKNHPVFGFGPGNFSYAFSSARPSTFNNNQFWQLRFDKSPIYILELVSTVGLLGLLSYMAVVGIFLFITFIFLKNIFRTAQEESYLAFSFSFMALSLFIAQSVYLSNTTLLFMFWLSLTMAMINWRFAFSKVFITREIDLQKYKDVFPVLSTIVIVIIFTFVVFTFVQIKYYKADVNYNNYRLSGQLPFLQTATKLAPHRINYDIALARYYMNISRADIDALSVSGQNDLSADAKAQLQDNIQKSIQAAQTAVNIEPNAVMTWELLGSIYRDVKFIALGSLDPAIKNFQKATNLEPTNPILLTELAKLYLAHNQTSEAVDTFKLAIDNKKDYIDAYIGLAKTYDALGQPDKAILVLEEVNQKQPNAEVIYESGRLYYNQNNFDKAIERFTKAIQLQPDYSNAIYSLGLAYQKKGENALALSEFNKALELNPNNIALKTLIGELNKNNQ